MRLFLSVNHILYGAYIHILRYREHMQQEVKASPDLTTFFMHLGRGTVKVGTYEPRRQLAINCARALKEK